MRRSSLRGIGLLATSAILLSACADDDATVDDVATDAATEAATDEPGEEATEAAAEGEWMAAVAALCGDYKADVSAGIQPIFQSAGESGPDGEAVRALFETMLPRLVEVRDAVADAVPAESEAAARDEFLTALDAQVTAWEAAKESPEAALAELDNLNGPFSNDAGMAADAAGAWQCGSGTVFMQAELSDADRAAATTVAVDAIDYGFEVDGAITAAGNYVLDLSNQGGEEHEWVVFRLAEGTTYQDAVAWLEENADSEQEPDFFAGPPVVGGFAAPQGRVEAAATFEAGTYMMICMIPAEDGVAHIAKGMHTEITVA